MSAVTDWRVELAAAREPLTEEQRGWDDHWRRRFDRLVDGGKSPNQAIPIAWRLTKRQHGTRPDKQGAQQT